MPLLHCEECGAEFERALKLQTGETVRIVCPECKSSGVMMVSPGMVTSYGKKFKITVQEIEDGE
jgi:DNA-directed RNA polymerase subunit RPC12/RpoP